MSCGSAAGKNPNASLLKDHSLTLFEALFRDNYERLFFFAYDLVRDRETAHDVVSDVFANVWQRRDQLQMQHTVAYLFTSVRNRSITHLRQAQRSTAIVEEVTAITDAYDDTDWMEHEARVNALHRELERMPERVRMVLHARFFEQRSNQEVAEMLGITVDGVKKIVQRAFATLRNNIPEGKKKLRGVPLSLLFCIYC